MANDFILSLVPLSIHFVVPVLCTHQWMTGQPTNNKRNKDKVDLSILGVGTTKWRKRN